MYCTKCGNQVDDSAAFCTKCGAPMNGKQSAANAEVKSHMVGAIIQTIICIPAGIVPLIYACKVNSRLAQGDIAGAQAASKKAKFWLNLTTIIVGALIILGFIVNAIEQSNKAAEQGYFQQGQEQRGDY